MIEEDIKYYSYLLKVIHVNLSDQRLFEKVERLLAQKIWEATTDENNMRTINDKFNEASVAHRRLTPEQHDQIALKKIFNGYCETQEFQDGRELPYVEEIMDVLLPVLSERYRTFIHYNKFYGPRKGHGKAAMVRFKNDEYLESLKPAIEELQASIDSLLKSKHKSNDKDLDIILNAGKINHSFPECQKQVMAPVKFDT